MKNYRIATIPGDGIGVEVTVEAVKALKTVEKTVNCHFDIQEFNWGAGYWKKTDTMVPDDFLDILKQYDAIFLGALGDPDIVPDHISLVPIIRIRQAFDQYICIRPAVLLPGVESCLAQKTSDNIDFLVLRENSEGEYVSVGGNFKSGEAEEISLQTAVHTRKGIERFLRHAYQTAQTRRRKLTLATKSNALEHGMVLWDTVFAELEPEFSDVQTEKNYIDALTMRFVREPESLDVVAGSNLFGDILSDLAGAVTGSIGLAPSANVNPEKKYPSLFEPVHGSAPDIAGQGIANPIAAIRSIAMMLDFLDETASARRIESAVTGFLERGTDLTPDLGGEGKTAQVGDEIAKIISSKP